MAGRKATRLAVRNQGPGRSRGWRHLQRNALRRSLPSQHHKNLLNFRDGATWKSLLVSIHKVDLFFGGESQLSKDEKGYTYP